MDQRIVKTKEKILKSFKTLIKQKRFEDITVQDILESADIARSTFYKHYQTKFDVLQDVIDSIFLHVFGDSLNKNSKQNILKITMLDFKNYIYHILYHLNEAKETIKALFNSSSKQFLIESIVNKFTPFARICLNNNFFYNYHIPKSLLLQFVVNNFVLLIHYWEKTDFKESPETLTEYFIYLNK